MTEGGIATWKKAEGDKFAPGDVLLEIVRAHTAVLLLLLSPLPLPLLVACPSELIFF